MEFGNSKCCGKAIVRRKGYPIMGDGKRSTKLGWLIKCSQCGKECEIKKPTQEKKE